MAYYSRLTQAESDKLERVQKTGLKTGLKVILGDMFLDYESALEMCGLDRLSNRRVKRCLDFAQKSLKHPKKIVDSFL